MIKTNIWRAYNQSDDLDYTQSTVSLPINMSIQILKLYK